MCELGGTMEYPGLVCAALWDKTDTGAGSLSRADCPPECGQPSPNQVTPEQNKQAGALAGQGAPPAGCLLAGTLVFPAFGPETLATPGPGA